MLVPLACAGETDACASEGVAEFCIGPGNEIRGSGFEPGTTLTASATFEGGDEGGEEAAPVEHEVVEDGWIAGTIAFLGGTPETIVVEGTREDGEPVRIVLEDPEL